MKSCGLRRRAFAEGSGSRQAPWGNAGRAPVSGWTNSDAEIYALRYIDALSVAGSAETQQDMAARPLVTTCMGRFTKFVVIRRSIMERSTITKRQRSL